MKRIVTLLGGALLSVGLLVGGFLMTGVEAKAEGPNYQTWDYKNEKAVVSPYDNYSCDQSAFNKVRWKLLSEAQLKEIANGIGTTNIKLDRYFSSGDVILGMKTNDAELALKAFQKMTFDGKVSPYLQIERLDYYAGTYSSIIIVRCDPQTKTEYSVSSYGFTSDNFGGIVYYIKTPKNDLKIDYYDTATMDKATVKYTQYLYVKRPHTNISDIYIQSVVGRKITGAPKTSAYCPLLTFDIYEGSLGGRKHYNIVYLYNLDQVAYKKGQYRKSNGYKSVELWIDNKRWSTMNFAK